MRWIWGVFVLLCAISVRAQVPGEEPKSVLGNPNHFEFGVHAGGFLPFGIFGVRSSYTAGGVRFNHHLGKYQTEVGYMYFNMESVTWNNLSYSIRSFLDYDYIKFYVFMGLDIHYYKPKPTNVRELPYTLEGGAHVGFSPLFEITKELFFRADFKMNFNPGQSLYAGVGLMYAIPQEGDKTNPENPGP